MRMEVDQSPTSAEGSCDKQLDGGFIRAGQLASEFNCGAGEMIAKRVFVVEDNADNREALAEILRGLGHEVEGAGSADQAYTSAPQFNPDAVILDLGLGHAEAPNFAMIRQLRASLGPAVRLVVYSGYHGLEADARSAGCDEYIIKPNLDALEALFGRPTTGSNLS